MTYPIKPNGDIQLCLGPKDLNKAILREHYKAPTLEEITHWLSCATIFSKMDTKEGFGAITLNYASSLLTMFNMPHGRYRFLCLSFGLKCSQDIFQMRMDQLISGLPGILAVHDDMTVYGKDEQVHDAALYNLMKTAKEYRLTFNSTKYSIKQPTIEFF